MYPVPHGQHTLESEVKQIASLAAMRAIYGLGVSISAGWKHDVSNLKPMRLIEVITKLWDGNAGQF